jgi:XRE family aerobic/anaerobic benzoate catabolism transcriptional regulator
MYLYYNAGSLMALRTPLLPADRRDGPEAQSYLHSLGERVRLLRTRRGISRKALAQHAEVSERYLAQLEGGEGNCSIVLLRRIGRALGVPVTQLVSEESGPPLDLVLFTQFLSRLSPQEFNQARDLVVEHFGGAAEDFRRRRIALIGLRGGGKSLLGGMLAERLGVPFIELDREIELLTGTTLSEIFEMFGQETFRHAEREALEKVLQRHSLFVMATSGSIVTEPRTFELLLSSCFTIWMRAEPADHMSRVVAQGDLRPMASHPRAMDDLVSILKSREPLYARAELTLNTSGRTPEQSLNELLRLVAPEQGRAAAHADDRRQSMKDVAHERG